MRRTPARSREGGPAGPPVQAGLSPRPTTVFGCEKKQQGTRRRSSMKRRILGGTGMSVSEYALGAMMFGAMGNTDHDESIRMIHTALDAGVNLIDTADVYSGGESEVIVGK